MTIGNYFSISVINKNTDEARRIFEALSADGNVTMPFDKTFWQSWFGMCVDKFGINWMVNSEIEGAHQEFEKEYSTN